MPMSLRDTAQSVAAALALPLLWDTGGHVSRPTCAGGSVPSALLLVVQRPPAPRPALLRGPSWWVTQESLQLRVARWGARARAWAAL